MGGTGVEAGGAASTTLPDASTVILAMDEASDAGTGSGPGGGEAGAGSTVGIGAAAGPGAGGGAGDGAGAGASAGTAAGAGAAFGNVSKTARAALARATAEGKSPPALVTSPATVVSIL